MSLDDYVLTQPPIYGGPPRPIDPSDPDKPPPISAGHEIRTDHSGDARVGAKYFQFTPQRPASELEFKRAYAKAVAAEGVAPELAVRLYDSKPVVSAPTMSSRDC